jgi:hypothetical protein
MRKLVSVLLLVAAAGCGNRVRVQQPTTNGLGEDPQCPPHVVCGISTSPGGPGK